MENNIDNRVGFLKSLNASTSEIEELLVYNQNLFDHERYRGKAFPLSDEPHLPIWESYRKEAETKGVFPVLQKSLVQFRFPIEAGISQTENYRMATRRGMPVENKGFTLEQPETLKLIIHQTPAGNIPLLYTGNRRDFISLVQALSKRNEPVPIPGSMGAQIVSGYNNWDRIAAYRRNWEESKPDHDWDEEFQRLLPQKELYQDTFIILSDNEYSGVPAQDLGLDETVWRGLSLTIRREHECTHYVTRRLLGTMRNNMLDEIIADYTGIREAFGYFRADYFLRFIGLENFPLTREGGRIDIYRGDPPLSEGAFAILKQLVVKAAHHLEHFDQQRNNTETAYGNLPVLIALTLLTLEELASDTSDNLWQEALLSALKWCKGGLT